MPEVLKLIQQMLMELELDMEKELKDLEQDMKLAELLDLELEE